jgi:hypothetical protein
MSIQVFNMPRELVAETHADEFGVVHIKRDDSWITSYNPAIATCLRSNHDISRDEESAFIYTRVCVYLQRTRSA